MSKIVYAWELGGGLGHVSVAAPILSELQRRGHLVIAVVCDLATSDQLFGPLGIRCYQAPRCTRPPQRTMQPPCTFAHVLNNRTFGARETTLAIAKSWRWLIEDLNPDLLIFDHCPSGLLASRGLAVKRVTIGTGFTSPPAVSPLPNWRADAVGRAAQLVEDERQVLQVANEALDSLNAPPLRFLTELYRDVDELVLTTYSELDHFGPRPGTTYYGAWPMEWGDEPVWPSGVGKRVFAYLKDAPELRLVLESLCDTKQPSVVYCPNADSFLARQAMPSNIHYMKSPVRMTAAVASCDFAILNGTHTTIAQMLRGGRPVISVPIFLEQQITGELVARMSAGLCLTGLTQTSLANALQTMNSEPELFVGARKFSEKYGRESPASALERIVHTIEAQL